jgi:hypothetical protein
MNRTIRYFLALAAFLATARQSMGNSTQVICDGLPDAAQLSRIINDDPEHATPIPEPTSVAILLIGVGSVLTRRRRIAGDSN